LLLLLTMASLVRAQVRHSTAENPLSGLATAAGGMQ
jgi:hypothetical protein